MQSEEEMSAIITSLGPDLVDRQETLKVTVGLELDV